MLRAPFAAALATAIGLGVVDRDASRSITTLATRLIEAPVRNLRDVHEAHARHDRGLRRYRQRESLGRLFGTWIEARPRARIVDFGVGAEGTRARDVMPVDARIERSELLALMIAGRHPTRGRGWPESGADLVLGLGNGIAYLPAEVTDDLFGLVHASLAPNGLFAFDAVNAAALAQLVVPGLRVDHGDGASANAGPVLFRERVDAARGCLVRLRLTPGEGGAIPATQEAVELRAFDADGVKASLAQAGFERIRVLSLGAEAFDPQAPGFLVLAEKGG
jgi:hypothetical protein